MTDVYQLNPDLQQQSVIIKGAPGGSSKMFLCFDQVPSAGIVTVEYMLAGNLEWILVQHAYALALTSEVIPFRIDGPVAAVRITFDGLDGGAPQRLIVDRQLIPADAFIGQAAMTVQSYTEANVKNGLQFEYSFDAVAVTATTGKVSAIFLTGTKPVIVKARIIDFTGKKIRARVFRAPVYTGGTPNTPYNLNDTVISPSTVSVISGATISNDGVEFGAPNTIYGSDLQGNSVQGTFAVTGQERILRPMTAYHLMIENLGDTTSNISGYLTWYEGRTDLPL